MKLKNLDNYQVYTATKDARIERHILSYYTY